MKLYIVRHGESETNKKGLWTGWLDVPLTEGGMRDAETAKAILSGIKFDKVYSSDLSRAKKTCEIALDNIPYETLPLLREVNVGNIAGKPLTVISNEERAEISRFGYRKFDGESREDLKNRVCEFMKKVSESGYESVAAFSHAGFIHTMLCTVLEAEISRKNTVCNNCTVAIFEFTNGIWRLHSWINNTVSKDYDGN